MADDKLQKKLVEYIEDARSMEQNVLRMLDWMISTFYMQKAAGLVRGLFSSGYK